MDHRRAARRGRPSGSASASPGANDRIWNAARKLALAEPGRVRRLLANDVVALGFAGLAGPDVQVTSQINIVNPGGAAQLPHHNYHLGMVAPEH